MAEVRVRNEELRTVREAMRDLNRMVDELETGHLDKLVLTQRNRMRAVVLSAERYGQLQRLLERDEPSPMADNARDEAVTSRSVV